MCQVYLYAEACLALPRLDVSVRSHPPDGLHKGQIQSFILSCLPSRGLCVGSSLL